jgi:hypothetical protein
MLVVIAALLGMIVFRPIVHPAPLQAQASEAYPFYLEPGYTTQRKPDGTGQVYGKVAIDMRNGDICGFPTTVQGPYPIDNGKTLPPKSHPFVLGRVHVQRGDAVDNRNHLACSPHAQWL